MKYLNKIIDKLIIFCEYCEKKEKARYNSKFRDLCMKHKQVALIALELYKLCLILSCIDIVLLPISVIVKVVLMIFWVIVSYTLYRVDLIIDYLRHN